MLNLSSIFDKRSIYPQLLAEIQSPFLGLGGSSSVRATPPVSRNLRPSSFISYLNAASLVDNMNESSSLSFSKRDLQMLEYKEYRK